MVSNVQLYQGNPKPKQKIPSSEKTKEWAAASGAYFRDSCKPAANKAEALKWYRLANGELQESDYTYVTNPLNTTRHELSGYPARLMNYDIISPNVNLLLGEKARRFFPPIVIAKNTDYHIKALEEEQRLLVQELQKRFVNELVAAGIPLDKEVIKQELESIAGRVKNLPDELTSQAQDVMDYMMVYNDLPRHLRKGFYDWVCQAMVYSYKDVCRNKTYYEIISCIHLKYLCAPQHDFIEDGDAVCAEHIFSINEIYDRFQDDPDFDKEVEEFIQQHSNQDSYTQGAYGYGTSDIDTRKIQGELFQNLFGYLPEEQYANGVRVEHIQWRSFTKIGKLVIPDMFGNKMTYEVDDSFKPMPTDDISWEWVDEIWESYCLDGKYWLGSRPIPIQRGAYNDPHKAKLLYNGRNYFARHTRPTSLVKKGLAFQKSVNIVKYRAEETLAKNLDKVVLFPLGMIPKKEGWDEFKLMYYVRAFGFLFFDDTRPNAAAMVQAMKDIDLSAYQHLLQSYQLIQTFKQEWDEVCGIIPQRKGQVSASAGQGVTQEANTRSYVMSETLFLQYEEFEQREYTGMVELSKYAFVDGIQSHFIKQDGTRAFLNLHDPDSFINSDIAIFVKNGGREAEKLEIMRNQVQAFAQNSVDPKMIAGIVEAENFSKLHQIMDEIDARAQANRQAEQQKEIAIQQSIEAVEQRKLDYEYYDTDIKSYTEISVALIKEGMDMADNMKKLSDSGKGDSSEMMDLRDNFEKNAIALLQNSTKLKEIASKEKMNKLDNETKLKNPTAGEK